MLELPGIAITVVYLAGLAFAIRSTWRLSGNWLYDFGRAAVVAGWPIAFVWCFARELVRGVRLGLQRGMRR